jgi:hypothetical protein
MEKKFEITKFETLENSAEMLKGGFSTAYAGGARKDVLEECNDGCTSNNCQGGNCFENCACNCKCDH